MTVFYWPRPEAGVTAGKNPAATSPAISGLRKAVRLTWPAAGANADVVINPKKALLTVDFAAVVNEVNRAFVVIEQKLAGKAAPPKI